MTTELQNEGSEPVTKSARIKAMQTQLTVMRHQMLKAADAIDALRAENKELRDRGDKLVHALDTNDGTVDAAWKIGNAVSAWQEFTVDE